MFGSRSDRTQNAQNTAANAKRKADAYRKETDAAVRYARGSRYQAADNNFTRGWKPQRDVEQQHLDARVRETAKAAKKAKRSWW